jgi:hypothetical protein
VTMGCGDVCPYVPTRVDDWDIPDPVRDIDWRSAAIPRQRCLWNTIHSQSQA